MRIKLSYVLIKKDLGENFFRIIFDFRKVLKFVLQSNFPKFFHFQLIQLAFH